MKRLPVLKRWISSVILLGGVLSACNSNSNEVSNPTTTSVPATPTEQPAALTGDEILLVTGDFPPATGEALAEGGYATAIIKAIFAEMGRPIRIEFYPWARAEAMVESGEAWGTFPYNRNDERAAKFFFSEPIFNSLGLFFYYGDKMAAVEYEELGDLSAYRIGGATGYWYVPVFEEAGLNVEIASDDLANLNKLVAGRIDLYPIKEDVGWWLIQTSFAAEIDSFGTLAKPYSENSSYVMVSRSYPDSEALLQAFNSALAEIQANGTYAAILEQFNISLPLPGAATTSNQ